MEQRTKFALSSGFGKRKSTRERRIGNDSLRSRRALRTLLRGRSSVARMPDSLMHSACNSQCSQLTGRDLPMQKFEMRTEKLRHSGSIGPVGIILLVFSIADRA